jgi:AraC-like DNA-binding protein
MEDQLKTIIRSLLAYAAQRDMSPEILCKLSNITISELHNQTTKLSAKQAADVWINAIHLSKDKLFGLHFGESLQLSALGIVGDIIKNSNTVGDAITIAASLTHHVTSAFKLEVFRNTDNFAISFIPEIQDCQNNLVARQILDLLMVFVIHELDGLMLKKIKPESVTYGYPIVDIDEYARVMRCVPKLGRSQNMITFDSKYWDEPIITANYELQRVLLEKISTLKKPLNETHALQSRILSFLFENSYLGLISLEDIAANFNISPRTLQRKLKNEGISFQQVADEARKTLAINYLKAGSHPIKEVSYMLGYNELSAFTRTFKRWTGTTPVTFQKSNENIRS